MKIKYIYVAGPYTKPDPVQNTNKVIRYADMLREIGYIPFVPHLTLLWHFLCPHEVDYWYEYDLAWLEKCDCLLRVKGESFGADAEVEYAKKKGIPVYYSVRELIKNESH